MIQYQRELMIDRKLILYVVVGVVAFALWDAWQKDYNKPNESPTVITTTINSTSNDPAPTTSSTLVPATTLPTGQQDPIKTPAARLITVHTDVLDVMIDTLGGNIVGANLLKYPDVKHQTQPIKLLDYNPDRYYVAESGLISDLGPDSRTKQATYTSSQREYAFDPKKDSLNVSLVWTGKNGITVTKNFIFTNGKYDIAVEYEINNKSIQGWVGQFYAEIKRKEFDVKGGMFQFNSYTGAAVSSTETPYEKVSFSDIEKATKNNKEFIRDNQGGWIAMQQQYFLTTWVPVQEKTYRYFNNVTNGVYTVGLSDNAVTVPAGQKAIIKAVLYAGPQITENIAHLAKGLDRTIDYVQWLWVICVGFFWLLKNIYKVVGNWGWSIILVTIIIKGLFYKLSESSCRSMARMRELMPKIQAIKERYSDDRQKLHQATMDLYKQEKVNPLNLGGCLPMLIQIPFFIALYYVLMGAVELRHAPFMFWIQDLSSKDPYYILPVLMGISMFLQQRLTPTSADPAQAKMMMLMPVLFTFFFLNFPSGLVLYWFVSNLLSVAQQWYINKRLASETKVCRR